MHFLVVANLVTIGALLTGYVFKKLRAHQACNQAMYLNGCKPVRQWPHKVPLLGFDRIKRVKKAMKDGNAQEIARQDYKACGKTFQVYIMGTAFLYIMDWKNIHTVQSVEFEKWGVSPRRGVVSVMMGNGITVSHGPVWSRARKNLRPVFEKSTFDDLEKRSFEKHFVRMLKHIPRDGSTVDLQSLFQRMFINVSMEYIFGETRFSEADGSCLEADQFVVDYNDAIRIVAKMNRFGMTTPFDTWRHKGTLNDCVKRLRSYVDQRIEDSLKKKRGSGSDKYQRPDSNGLYVFLDQLIYETEDQTFLRDQLMNIFFPARNASSAAGSKPKFLEKASLRNFKHRTTFTRRALNSMTYLNQVINECLRLLSPANRALRTCIKDCVLPLGGGADGKSPIYVPAGVHICMDFGLVHRDEDLWGADASKFRPERWESLDPNTKYYPFFAGPRKCPAQQMLLTQYKYLLARMASMFERMDNKDEVLEFVEEHNMTITSRNGVKVALILDTQECE